MSVRSIAGSVARIGAVVIGGAAVLMSAGVGTSLCGCPANCSPVVCVDISSSGPTLYDPEKCTFSECAGIELPAPGSRKFTGGTYGNVTCTIYKGIQTSGGCVFNPNGTPVGTYTTTGYSGASSSPC